jgi:hypothetical protein
MNHTSATPQSDKSDKLFTQQFFTLDIILLFAFSNIDINFPIMTDSRQEKESTMTSTPEPQTGSPENSPPTTAILPSSLVDARAKHQKARSASTDLQIEYDTLSNKVEPEVEPDEMKPEPSHEESIQLTKLGIELASRIKEEIRLERDVVRQEHSAGMLKFKALTKRLVGLDKRFLSAGGLHWQSKKKRMCLEDSGVIRLSEPGGSGVAECLLALYKKSDGLERSKPKRPSNWRQDALKYYKGTSEQHSDVTGLVWCHISGTWYDETTVKAAHIVPFFVDLESIGEVLFGSQSESLQRAGNSLLLSHKIKGWFDKYFLVVVPVDATETPIKRWKTDVISADITKAGYGEGHLGAELDGKELKFLGEKRPVARFLYFHFVMALVRIKSLERQGWEQTWARYYEQRPFPTPGNYMRKSMLLALATHFETTDLQVVDSWIKDHGFEAPLKMTHDESTEIARRVFETVLVDESGERERVRDDEGECSHENASNPSEEEEENE